MIKTIILTVAAIAINVTLSVLAVKGTFEFFTEYERKTRERRNNNET